MPKALTGACITRGESHRQSLTSVDIVIGLALVVLTMIVELTSGNFKKQGLLLTGPGGYMARHTVRSSCQIEREGGSLDLGLCLY